MLFSPHHLRLTAASGEMTSLGAATPAAAAAAPFPAAALACMPATAATRVPLFLPRRPNIKTPTRIIPPESRRTLVGLMVVIMREMREKINTLHSVDPIREGEWLIARQLNCASRVASVSHSLLSSSLPRVAPLPIRIGRRGILPSRALTVTRGAGADHDAGQPLR